MYDATLINGKNNRELYTGALLKASGGQIVNYSFKYKPLRTREYNVMTSAMPGHEYIQPTETIWTTRLDLPFAKGDKIIMADGRTMNVKTARYEHDEKRAFMSDGRIAWVITLEGGA